MDLLQVRDLIAHLQTFPPEMKIVLIAETEQGVEAKGDNYQLLRREDVIQLRTTGIPLETMPFGV